MVDLLGPAPDPAVRPVRLYSAGAPLEAPTAEPPEPGPGDPDAEFDAVAAAMAPRFQVLLYRYDKTLIGELVTATVDDWNEELDLLVPPTARVTASVWDPVLASAGDAVGVDAFGEVVYSWDPKGYWIQINVDGDPEPPFFFRQPIDIGDGKVALVAVGVQAVVSERILGRAEQPDLLEGVGSFEDYASIAAMEADGWQFDAGVTASLVTDGVRGTKALSLTGAGWVRSPRVVRQGADGYGRVIEGAAFVKLSGGEDDLAKVETVHRTRAVRRSNGAEDLAYRDANRSGVPTESGWSEDPITSAGRMQPAVVGHDCGVDIRSHAGVTTRVDVVTLRESVQTGFPPGSTQDYASYVERIFRDLHARSLGGSPTGLSTRIVGYTGNNPAQAIRWSHARQIPVREALSMILDADGGPECRVTAGWWLDITDRLGADRSDIALSNHDIIAARWATDPGAQADVYVANTGRGSGASLLASIVEQPYSDTDTRWRIVFITQAPDGMSLNAVDEWTRRQAEVAARSQVTATVAVRWHLGRQIATGDTLAVFQSDGLMGDRRFFRVVARKFDPRSLTVELTLGAAA